MSVVSSTAVRSSPVVVAFASLIGTTTEWYDFYIFGAASALVFPRLFFPMAGSAGVLAAFAVFWVAFLGRPIGATLFGHFGDRIGRKAMLILALVLMGSGTVSIGLLPTYGATGFWAPLWLIVLRLLQGVAVGGEWGGAVLMATEHAPPGERGFFGSFPQMGSPIGAILSNGVFASVMAAFSSHGQLSEAFFKYGWRIPFVASAVLILVGLVVRLTVTESPAFERMRARAVLVKAPVLVALRTQWRTMLLAGGALFAVNVGYLYSTQIIAYASGAGSLLRVPASQITAAVSLGSCAWLVAVGVGGWLSDRFGRRVVALCGAGLTFVLGFPIYLLIDTKHFPAIAFAECIAFTASGLLYGPLAALYCEAFGGNVRYSAASIAYHSAALIGGMSPFLGTALLHYSGGKSWVLSTYIMVTATISLASLFYLTDHRRADLASSA